MASLGQSLDLVFKMKAEGADAVQRDIKQTSAIIQKETGNTSLQTKTQLDDLTKSSATSSGALASLGAIASGTAVAVGALAVGVGAAAYGLFTLANAAAKSGQDLFKLQQATGLNAETLSSLRLAAIEANVELGSLNDILVDFTQLMLQAAGGNEEAKKKLEELGVTAKNADQGVAQLLKTIYEAPDIYKAAELASKATGASIADLQRIAIAAKGEMEALKQRAKELGITLDNDAARAANEFAKDMEIVTLQVQSQAYAFAREYMPQISSAMRSVGQFLADNREAFVFWGQTVGYYIYVHIDSFAIFARAVHQAGAAVFSAMQSMASSVSSAMISIGNSIGGVIGWFVTLIGLMAKARLIAGQANGTGEGSAGLGLGSPDAFLTSVPKVSVGGGGGGGRARSGGGGRGGAGARAQLDEVAQQEKIDALKLQAKKDALAELAAQDKKDLADRKISKEAYDALQRANDAEYLAYEYELLNERAKIASATVEQRNKMAADLATIQSRIRAMQLEAEAEATENQREQNEQRMEDAFNAEEYLAKLRAERQESEEDYLDRIAVKERKRLEQNVIEAEQNLRYARTKSEIDQATAEHLTALIVLRQFDIARLEKARQLADDKAKAEASAAVKSLEDYKLTETQKAEARVEIDKKLNNDLLVNYEQYLAGKKVVEDKAGAAAAVQVTPNDIEDPLAFINEERITPKEFLLNQLKDAFNGVANAVGNAVSAWVLYGKAGASVRQVAAQILASIAQMAAIEAVWNLAQGFAKLAMAAMGHPTAGLSAGMHFKSAAMFGVIAIGSAIAGRAVAGSGGGSTQNQAYDFRSNTIDSNNSSQAAGNTTQMLSESRTQRQDQRITLEVTSRDSHIVRVVGDNLNQRGDLFPVVVRLVEQN